MIVLDTNVVSEMMRSAGADNVRRWLDERPVPELVITSVTAAELRAGVAVLADGARRTGLAAAVEAVIDETFSGAVLPFDADSADHYAAVVATRRRAGRPITSFDAQIAAIARQHGAELATRNVRDFAGLGLTVHDPWTA